MTTTPSTDLTHHAGEARLAINTEQTWWTDAQWAALAAAGLGDVPQGDLVAFLHQCQKSGLDPFTREVYLIGYKDSSQPSGKKWSTQTGIDGYRHIAERTGEFLGSVGPWWCGPDGQWVDVWLSEEPPAAAKFGVLRAGHPEPFTAVAPYREFAVLKDVWENNRKTGRQEPNAMWKKMPAHMLAKCAEALAIRRAFPRQTAGIYTTDEMGARMEQVAEEQRAQLAAEREASRAAYVRRPWDKEATEEPASPADTAPGDVVPGETVVGEAVAEIIAAHEATEAEVMPDREELMAELAEQAILLDTSVAALANRAVRMYRKNLEDFNEEELYVLVNALRPQAAEAARNRTTDAVEEVAQAVKIPDEEIARREEAARAERIAESAEADAQDARARADALAKEQPEARRVMADLIPKNPADAPGVLSDEEVLAQRRAHAEEVHAAAVAMTKKGRKTAESAAERAARIAATGEVLTDDPPTLLT